MTGAAPDRLTVQPMLWAGAVCLWFRVGRDLGRFSKLDLLIILSISISLLALGVGLLIVLVVNLYRQRWLRVASVLAAPALGGLLFITLGHLGASTELIRLEVFKPYYLSQVSEDKNPDNGFRLSGWHWGDNGGIGWENVYILVYDESDEVALPPGEQSESWMQRAKAAGVPTYLSGDFSSHEEGKKHVEAEYLDGHFYLVTFYW